MPNSGISGKTKLLAFLGGGLALATIGLATPAEACLDCQALDAAMGALPGTQSAGTLPQPLPPATPALSNGAAKPTAALLLPAVQAAREAARRSPASGAADSRSRVSAAAMLQQRAAAPSPSPIKRKHIANLSHETFTVK